MFCYSESNTDQSLSAKTLFVSYEAPFSFQLTFNENMEFIHTFLKDFGIPDAIKRVYKFDKSSNKFIIKKEVQLAEMEIKDYSYWDESEKLVKLNITDYPNEGIFFTSRFDYNRDGIKDIIAVDDSPYSIDHWFWYPSKKEKIEFELLNIYLSIINGKDNKVIKWKLIENKYFYDENEKYYDSKKWIRPLGLFIEKIKGNYVIFIFF
jgi:hypothetical protein